VHSRRCAIDRRICIDDGGSVRHITAKNVREVRLSCGGAAGWGSRNKIAKRIYFHLGYYLDAGIEFDCLCGSGMEI
jgi:hypothetical protein